MTGERLRVQFAVNTAHRTVHSVPVDLRSNAVFKTVARSGVAGVAATLSDLATLTLLVKLFGLDPRAANVPALLVGAVVNFIGNRRYAFHAAQGGAAKQAVGYSLVEAVALALNGGLYEGVLRAFPQVGSMFWLVRLVVSCAVFLGWSYPLWRRVFRVKIAAQKAERRSSGA